MISVKRVANALRGRLSQNWYLVFFDKGRLFWDSITRAVNFVSQSDDARTNWLKYDTSSKCLVQNFRDLLNNDEFSLSTREINRLAFSVHLTNKYRSEFRTAMKLLACQILSDEFHVTHLTIEQHEKLKNLEVSEYAGYNTLFTAVKISILNKPF